MSHLIRDLTALASALCLTACAGVPSPDRQPWVQGEPAEAGFDADALARLVEELREGEHGVVDHFLLIRGGRKVVDERFEHASRTPILDLTAAPPRPVHDYANPAWHPYLEGTDLHTLQSVTKSVTSIAVGMAIADGALPGVEAPLLDHLEGVEVSDDPRWADLILADLLTMRSGIDWSPPAGSEGFTVDHPTLQMERSDDWLPFITARPLRVAPGTEFEYVDGASVLIGHVLHQALGERVDAYLERRLFEPLGIETWYWKTSPAGELDTEGGLYLTAEGLARIGALFLNDGQWNGAQLVPAAWVAESTAPHVEEAVPGFAYGYQWWVPQHEGGQARIFSAFGFGGQLLIVHPESGTLAVFLGWEEPQRVAPLFAARVLSALD